MIKKNEKFQKVLIANRGEIALRIIRACKELDLKTVALYSPVDKGSAHVLLADEAIPLDKNPVSESYLNKEKILEACQKTQATAIHPGFGFFSENASFAEACEKKNITFIGPSAKTISLMGDKLQARAIMQEAGVPIVPGSEGAIKDMEAIKKTAKKIGFPVLLKAAAGGGGKGMRIVHSEKELKPALENTRREAKNFFGNDTIFLEKFLQDPHHIEVQILGDKHGNLVHFYERECSIQRRHQKVIEEAPAPFLLEKEEVKEKLFQVALAGAKKVGYYSAGTMEFVMDTNYNFYFLEMNTRIQVEHPVSEMISGMDLVKEQIRIAMEEPLGYEQKDIIPRGHSIECRLCAEDPETFVPSPGYMEDYLFPGGPFIRVDTAMMRKEKIPLEYDPMIAKICSWGKDRKEAIHRMIRALSETMLVGTTTNLNLLAQILKNKTFQSGNYSTKFIEEERKNMQLKPKKEEIEELIALLSLLDKNKNKIHPGEAATWIVKEQEAG